MDAGSGWRGGPAGPDARSDMDSRSCQNSAAVNSTSVKVCSGRPPALDAAETDNSINSTSVKVCSGWTCRPDTVSSTGSVRASVYIQMLSQDYSSLKCFQDFKAFHVCIYHCHTPLLFLQS